MISSINNLINHIAHPVNKRAVKKTSADEKTKAVAAKHINQKPLTEAQKNLLLGITLVGPNKLDGQKTTGIELKNRKDGKPVAKTTPPKQPVVATNIGTGLTEYQSKALSYFT